MHSDQGMQYEMSEMRKGSVNAMHEEGLNMGVRMIRPEN